MFLDTIKRDLLDEPRRCGLRGQCLVNTHALMELIEHFERLDSAARVQHDYGHAPLPRILNEVLHALYCTDRDGESLIIMVMEIIARYIREHRKLSYMNNVFK